MTSLFDPFSNSAPFLNDRQRLQKMSILRRTEFQQATGRIPQLCGCRRFIPALGGATMDTPETTPPPSGLGAALGAYVIWGFLPLYLILV